jgi:hypothetical protein
MMQHSGGYACAMRLWGAAPPAAAPLTRLQRNDQATACAPTPPRLAPKPCAVSHLECEGLGGVKGGDHGGHWGGDALAAVQHLGAVGLDGLQACVCVGRVRPGRGGAWLWGPSVRWQGYQRRRRLHKQSGSHRPTAGGQLGSPSRLPAPSTCLGEGAHQDLLHHGALEVVLAAHLATAGGDARHLGAPAAAAGRWAGGGARGRPGRERRPRPRLWPPPPFLPLPTLPKSCPRSGAVSRSPSLLLRRRRPGLAEAAAAPQPPQPPQPPPAAPAAPAARSSA